MKKMISALLSLALCLSPFSSNVSVTAEKAAAADSAASETYESEQPVIALTSAEAEIDDTFYRNYIGLAVRDSETDEFVTAKGIKVRIAYNDGESYIVDYPGERLWINKRSMSGYIEIAEIPEGMEMIEFPDKVDFSCQYSYGMQIGALAVKTNMGESEIKHCAYCGAELPAGTQKGVNGLYMCYDCNMWATGGLVTTTTTSTTTTASTTTTTFQGICNEFDFEGYLEPSYRDSIQYVGEQFDYSRFYVDLIIHTKNGNVKTTSFYSYDDYVELFGDCFDIDLSNVDLWNVGDYPYTFGTVEDKIGTFYIGKDERLGITEAGDYRVRMMKHEQTGKVMVREKVTTTTTTTSATTTTTTVTTTGDPDAPFYFKDDVIVSDGFVFYVNDYFVNQSDAEVGFFIADESVAGITFNNVDNPIVTIIRPGETTLTAVSEDGTTASMRLVAAFPQTTTTITDYPGTTAETTTTTAPPPHNPTTDVPGEVPLKASFNADSQAFLYSSDEREIDFCGICITDAEIVSDDPDIIDAELEFTKQSEYISRGKITVWSIPTSYGGEDQKIILRVNYTSDLPGQDGTMYIYATFHPGQAPNATIPPDATMITTTTTNTVTTTTTTTTNIEYTLTSTADISETTTEKEYYTSTTSTALTTIFTSTTVEETTTTIVGMGTPCDLVPEYNRSPMKIGETRPVYFYDNFSFKANGLDKIESDSDCITYSYDDAQKVLYVTAVSPGRAEIGIRDKYTGCVDKVYLIVTDETYEPDEKKVNITVDVRQKARQIDINKNGRFDAEDVCMLCFEYNDDFEPIEISDEMWNYADINGDGSFTDADLTKLLAYLKDTSYPGDVNEDGMVTAADASFVLKYSADYSQGEPSIWDTKLTEEVVIMKCSTYGDMNGDGKITAADASLILVSYAEMSGD